MPTYAIIVEPCRLSSWSSGDLIYDQKFCRGFQTSTIACCVGIFFSAVSWHVYFAQHQLMPNRNDKVVEWRYVERHTVTHRIQNNLAAGFHSVHCSICST